MPSTFIDWNLACIYSPHYFIVVNGELAGYFPGKKGLHQGDFISSSSLFILAMDILSKQLDKDVAQQVFAPHPQCVDPLITHLSFADDILILFDETESSLQGILGIWYGSGIVPVKYQGLPLLPHKLRPIDYQPLIDKIRTRISSWIVRQLSLMWQFMGIMGEGTHYQGPDLLGSGFQKGWSWIWRQLVKLRPLARPLLHCQIVSSSTAFLGMIIPLLDMIGETGPQVTCIPYLSTVSQVVVNGSWNLSTSRNQLIWPLRTCLPSNLHDLSIHQFDEDSFLWQNSPTTSLGIFSTSKTWIALNPVQLLVFPWLKSVWFPQVIPKHACIFWLLLRDRLSTRDKLIIWCLAVPEDCLLCDSAQETSSHRFLDRQYSFDVWPSFFAQQNQIPPSSFTQVVYWVRNSSSNSQVKIITKLLLQGISEVRKNARH